MNSKVSNFGGFQLKCPKMTIGRVGHTTLTTFHLSSKFNHFSRFLEVMTWAQVFLSQTMLINHDKTVQTFVHRMNENDSCFPKGQMSYLDMFYIHLENKYV